MNLTVLLPDEVFLREAGVEAVTAPGGNGSFGLLEHHIDFTSALVPGILVYRRRGEERYLALDEGIIVKTGQEVRISTRRAVAGGSLEQLGEVIRRQFVQRDESEKKARAALVRLEARLTRRLLELRRG